MRNNSIIIIPISIPILFVALAPLSGCSDDDDSGNQNTGVCAPGATRPCDCVIGGTGQQTCEASGQWSTPCVGCGECGNGHRDYSEWCDGTDLAGATCASQGFAPGTLACLPDCTFDTSGCGPTLCGNQQIDSSEMCDGTELGGATCQTFGFDGGTVDCTATCAFDTSGCTGTPIDCAAATAALAGEMYATPGRSCTATVRLHYQTRAVLGFALLCGGYQAVDEATARVTAQTDTGYGQGGTLLSGPAPEDAWVFYEAPGDFGGASAVSSHTGLTVFGGSIVWDGAGDLVYPDAWRPGSELGGGCTPHGATASSRGFDLEQGGAALATSDMDWAINMIWQTALPAAFWQGGYVFDAVVLLYPRTTGAFDPAAAEWIVLLSGGWLE